jgi:hypothetical protein
MQVRKDLSENVTLQIQAGNSSVWSSPWFPMWEDVLNHLLLPVTMNPLPSKVSDLWHTNSKNRDNDLLNNIFDVFAVQEITKMHPVPNDHQGILRWKPSTNGICSTKAIYRHLASQQTIILPTTDARSISHHANQLLKKVWRKKILPPLIKAFAWRLIRRALATAERASRYSTHIDDHNCSTCG